MKLHLQTDIVLLAAGTSSRMGSMNKMLLPVEEIPMCVVCAKEALRYLKNNDENGKLIIVVGYKDETIRKSLEAIDDERIIVVKNENYERGQFSSTKVGVKQVRDNACFFIALADMPLIRQANYAILAQLMLNNSEFDVIRPFYNQKPGHPVLLRQFLKNIILAKPDIIDGKEYSVREIISEYKTMNYLGKDSSWIADVDTDKDFTLLADSHAQFQAFDD